MRAGPQRPYRRPPIPPRQDDSALVLALAAIGLAIVGLVLLWLAQ